MNLFRYERHGRTGIGAVIDDRRFDLTATAPEFADIGSWLSSPDPAASARRALEPAKRFPLSGDEILLAPLDRQEVWASGVTYLRSKVARMEESEQGGDFYDLVYDAVRPELFFKANPSRVSGPGQPIRIRRDSTWNVPEPELALVLSSRGAVVGYTIGNDVSSRSIEGENPLYLPQAKVYDASCALGPTIALEDGSRQACAIRLTILRGGAEAFAGETSTTQIRRSFAELAGYLFREMTFPEGAILLTGTGIVPPDHFTLNVGDIVRIAIDGIGVLENAVEQAS